MRFIGIILLSPLLAVFLPAYGQYRLNNGIAAIANDAVITHQDVLRQSEEVISVYRRTYFNNPEAFKQRSELAMTEALEQLIDQQLVLHDFKNLGGTIQESWVDDNIKERIRDQFGDRVTFTKSLQAQGITYEAYRQKERDRFISLMMERKNVKEALLISPAKIERYYETNQNRFKLGDQIKLRMIRLSRAGGSSADEVRDLAVRIKSQVDAGAPFSEMASAYSEYWSKEGGLWGWKEEAQVKQGLSEIAFTLPSGQCGPVVGVATIEEGNYWVYRYDNSGRVAVARRFTERSSDRSQGAVEEKKLENLKGHEGLDPLPQEFYLMYVDEKRAARTRPLQEVREEIEKDLLLQERSRLQRKWIERLRAKSFVRYF